MEGWREGGRDGQGDLNFSMFPSPSGERGATGAFFIRATKSAVSSAKWMLADQYQSHSRRAVPRGTRCLWTAAALQRLLDGAVADSKRSESESVAGIEL